MICINFWQFVGQICSNWEQPIPFGGWSQTDERFFHFFNSIKYIFPIQTNAFFQFKQIHFVNLNKYICFNLNKYVCFNLNKYMSSIWTNTILQFEQIHFFNLNIYIFFSIWTNTNTNLFESDEADTICWQKLDGWAVFLLGYNCQYFPLFWKRVAKVIM